VEHLINALRIERDIILGERAKLAAEVQRLLTEQSDLSDKLFHIEKLLISYGVEIEGYGVLQNAVETGALDDSVVQSEKKARQPLLPQFRGLSLIEAIRKRIEEEPQRTFETKDFVGLLFGHECSKEQYATALRNLTAELSRGAKEGRWVKIPGKRGQYRFEKGDIEVEEISNTRNPRELKRPQFQRMGYIDITTQILIEHSQGLNLEDLTNLIFEFANDIEKEKAQVSLSVELNRAIREERLRKADDSELYFLPISKEGENLINNDSKVMPHKDLLEWRNTNET
jgi:hypothetical protein